MTISPPYLTLTVVQRVISVLFSTVHLPVTLKKEHLPLYLDNTTVLPEALRPEQSRIALLGARLFISLPGKELVQWLAGFRPAFIRILYTPRDLGSIRN